MTTCNAGCDDEVAEQRHALRLLLLEMGIEGDERYLGAGNTAIEIPSGDGQSTWMLSNLFDGQPAEWGADLEIDDGVVCGHLLGGPETSLADVARRFRDGCMGGDHPIPTELGPLTPAQERERDDRSESHEKGFESLLPSL